MMQKTVNPNATQAAKQLLNELSEIAGKSIVTGQHTQTIPMEEIDYIKEVTGKEPKLRGFELLAYSPNINYEDAGEECLTEVYENRGTVDTAIEWARKTGGIVTLSFHWFSPIGGRDKSFYAKNTEFDAEKILVENTPERNAFYHDMDVIAIELRKFENANIPVLWRPFHEADGDWFWWGAKGPVVASKLYRLMYEYYTNELHLNNLIWVWNCPVKEAYTGDDFVDVANGGQNAFSAVNGFVSVTEFEGFASAGGSARGGSAAANGAIGKGDFGFNGRVAAGINDLAAIDFDDFGVHVSKVFSFN